MADPTLADVQLHYSGATGTPVTSIGGAIHANRLLSQSVTGLTTITGVTIVDGMGNTPGNGTLTYSYSIPYGSTTPTRTLSWSGLGASTGTAVDVSAGGLFFIQSASNGGGLCVSVVSSSLPSVSFTNTLTVANVTQQMYLDQTKAESDAGVTKYRCFAIKNAHATLPMVNVKLYIAANTPGADSITIALDSLAAGVGGTGPTAIANENTAPAGVAFVAPDSITHADVLAVGTLAAGECRFFWVKQLTPANVSVATPVNTFNLGIYIRA